MAYHDELLQLAGELANKIPPSQADLRRAISTAYYALFHLLVSETTQNWIRDSSRDSLGRMFEHSQMKKASSRVLDSSKMPFVGEVPAIVSNLRFVARAFVQLQSKRHIADYDNTRPWTGLEAIEEVLIVARVFDMWRNIRQQNIAQEYLVSLLIRPRD